MPSSVLNVGKTMRSFSGGYRVSPGAVHEMIDHLDLWFETNMVEVCKVSKAHGRKTVMEEDVIEFFSITRNGVF